VVASAIPKMKQSASCTNLAAAATTSSTPSPALPASIHLSSSSSSSRLTSSDRPQSGKSDSKKLEPSYEKKISKLQKRAEREIACLTESFDHVRAALLNSAVDLSLVKELCTMAESTMLSLQSFAEKNLNCTDEALLKLQDESSFQPFKNLSLHPDALEKYPALFDTASTLSESLSNMHVVLSFIKNALASSTSVSLICKISEAAKVAKTSFVIPVSSLFEERSISTSLPEGKEDDSSSERKSSSPVPDASAGKTSGEKRSEHRRSSKFDDEKKEVAVRHKSKRMSLSSPDLVYMARLRAFTMRLQDAMGDCDKLIESVQNGTTKRDVLVSFIQQVRPFIALERQLNTFTQEHGISITDLPLPAGDADSILVKIQLVKYHLKQNLAYIEAIVDHVASAPKPLPKSLSSSIDSLIGTAEALFDA